MKKQILVVLLAAMALPVAASAAETFYVGTDIGRTQIKESDDGSKVNNTGFNLYGGVNFTENVGAEAGYVNFGKFTESNGIDGFTAKPTAFYAAATGTLPLGEGFALTAKLGLARTDFKVDANVGNLSNSRSFKHTSALIGIGATYSLSKNVSFIAQYEDFGKVADEEGVSVKAHTFAIGARYTF